MMPNVYPFVRYQFAPTAGPLKDLVAPSSGVVPCSLRKQLLSMNGNNIARCFLSETVSRDSPKPATPRAEFHALVESGVVERKKEPSILACFQHFTMPESGERLVRKMVIALGDLEPYENKKVYRHEHTLPARRAQQAQFLRDSGIWFDPLLMLYEEFECRIECIMDAARESTAPVAEVLDSDGVLHQLFEIHDICWIEEIQAILASQPLLIGDGHHRYEAALMVLRENPDAQWARRIPMAFANVRDPGLRQLATHRVISIPKSIDCSSLLGLSLSAGKLDSLEELIQLWTAEPTGHRQIGLVQSDTEAVTVFTIEDSSRTGVEILHEDILPTLASGIGGEAAMALRYVRGVQAAASLVHHRQAQLAFLLPALRLDEVYSTVLLQGKLMPPKSTDFYPKMPAGFVMHVSERSSLS